MPQSMNSNGFTRRELLGGAVSFAALSAIPKTAYAAGGRDPRLIVMILAGGVDGLALAAPTADPHYKEMRAGLTCRQKL